MRVFLVKEKTSRKRIRNPESWKRKKAAARQEGKFIYVYTYINQYSNEIL